MYDINNVSRGTIDYLRRYKSLILKWNKTINLVSCESEKDFWCRYVLDSLQLMKYINDLNIHLVDVGSGGVFPNIILSIVDIKKCYFN